MTNFKKSFQITPASMDDASEITALVIDCDIADFGQPDFVLEDLLDILGPLDLDKDTWVARSGERIIGFAFVEKTGEGALMSFGYVHPSYVGRGVGTELVERIEERAAHYAADHPEQGWVLCNAIPASNESARTIMAEREYAFKRLYSRMIIELTEEPVIRPPSAGIEIRPFQQGMEEAVFQAYRESFKDTNRFYETSFEEWMEGKSGVHYERNLWFTAWDGNELAGFIISKNFQDHVYIDLLGVRRAWRKQGAASALLLHVFKKAYELGIRNIRLSVDASSLTGANRLYEQLGMRAVFQQSLYQKDLKINK
ncbi:GNAT family N-acetyltransferase [Paenibacillus sedimenti]|uniref:GNAT family N-acetyltransferase n=1 Tax=Paenibacillus sedimenti TaxID=2770274 RepID=A0A926KTH7_9BACL|nr:GNAT family N-acetyltransferase [Paenibacillus sedimenti]MBD0383839.1 GNAT family N-acetyltransferase [Paenibacillus sedimenti]